MTSPPPYPKPARGAAPAPAQVVLGEPGAARHAVVLAPVMARWDDGAFFRQIAEPLLASEYRITIYDTLSLLCDGDDLKSLVERWARYLASDGGTSYGGDPYGVCSFGPPQTAAPDVLIGNALGGAVVQALLAHEWTRSARVVLLSGPTVADGGLNTKLERIAVAVGTQGLPAALRLLDEVVRGLGHERGTAPPPGNSRQGSQPNTSKEELAEWRLAAGLRLLHDVDVREPVWAFPGPLLHLYGEQSLLVQRKHLCIGRRAQHHLVGIPQAGMRPHADQPALTREAVARFLGAEQS